MQDMLDGLVQKQEQLMPWTALAACGLKQGESPGCVCVITWISKVPGVTRGLCGDGASHRAGSSALHSSSKSLGLFWVPAELKNLSTCYTAL